MTPKRPIQLPWKVHELPWECMSAWESCERCLPARHPFQGTLFWSGLVFGDEISWWSPAGFKIKILLPQPPKHLRLQLCTTIADFTEHLPSAQHSSQALQMECPGAVGWEELANNCKCQNFYVYPSPIHMLGPTSSSLEAWWGMWSTHRGRGDLTLFYAFL